MTATVQITNASTSGERVRVHRYRADLPPGEPRELQSEDLLEPGASLLASFAPGTVITTAEEPTRE